MQEMSIKLEKYKTGESDNIKEFPFEYSGN
jgi:hypothetical protein